MSAAYGHQPQDVHDAVLAGANPYHLAVFLAALHAANLECVHDGAQRLQALGLAAAEMSL
ncbi:hypothetical protein [Streptomyces sp. NPDC088736]|uniref:hypothetical protein n=1 Tax=Streptomyces sp. NPDC088736 TaxID=3365881 RepID=UPI0038044549